MNEKIVEFKSKAESKWEGVKASVTKNKKLFVDAGIAMIGLASAIITFAAKAKENSEWVEVRYHVKKDTYKDWTTKAKTIDELEEN